MLGLITLETPVMIKDEEVIVAQLKQAKIERDEARKRKFRSGQRDAKEE